MYKDCHCVSDVYEKIVLPPERRVSVSDIEDPYINPYAGWSEVRRLRLYWKSSLHSTLLPYSIVVYDLRNTRNFI
jgi:hypothetical protein